MSTLGEVKAIKSEQEIEWKIPNFTSVLDRPFDECTSSNFSFCNESWCLQLYPNNFYTSVFATIYLIRKSQGPPMEIEFMLGLKTVSGEREAVLQYVRTFENPEDTFGGRFIMRFELLEKKASLFPNDVITVFCCLQFPMITEITGDDETGKCFCCKGSLGNKVISLDEYCANRMIKCPDCSDIISLQNWLQGHECQSEKAKNYRSLIEEVRKTLDDCNHDLILKVGDEEFKDQQDILSALSEVFKHLLKSDMTEKNSGIIDVPDCDSNAMKVFFSCTYCGKVENLDQNNAIGLYSIADKYNMKIVKEKSSDFIKKSVSSINICEVIQLALNHSDSNLMGFATEFFLNNVLEILRTVEWQHFMKSNLTVAHELVIKSHEKKK